MGIVGKFLSDCRGSVAIPMAVLLPVIAAAAGGAIDLTNAMSRDTDLQQALDAATLSAARSTADDPSRKKLAQNIFDRNFKHCDRPLDTTIHEDFVEISATCDSPTTLLQIIGMTGIEIDGYAKAGYAELTGGAPAPLGACVLALHEIRRSININGQTDVTTDCGWHSNSGADDAFHYNGSGDFDLPSFSASGKIGGISQGRLPRAVIEDAARMADPLAAMPAPPEVEGGCTEQNFLANGPADVVMDPGVYCGDVIVNGSKRLTLNPGVYVIRGRNFIANGIQEVNGEGILLYGEKHTNFTFNGIDLIRLSGLETGSHAGFLIMQARDGAPEDQTATFNMSGQSYLEGTIYLPRHDFVMNGNSTFNHDAAYTKFIVDKYTLNGTGSLTMGSDYDRRVPLPAALTQTQSRRVVRLME